MPACRILRPIFERSARDAGMKTLKMPRGSVSPRLSRSDPPRAAVPPRIRRTSALGPAKAPTAPKKITSTPRPSPSKATASGRPDSNATNVDIPAPSELEADHAVKDDGLQHDQRQ